VRHHRIAPFRVVRPRPSLAPLPRRPPAPSLPSIHVALPPLVSSGQAIPQRPAWCSPASNPLPNPPPPPPKTDRRLPPGRICLSRRPSLPPSHGKRIAAPAVACAKNGSPLFQRLSENRGRPPPSWSRLPEIAVRVFVRRRSLPGSPSPGVSRVSVALLASRRCRSRALSLGRCCSCTLTPLRQRRSSKRLMRNWISFSHFNFLRLHGECGIWRHIARLLY
jgi:hypothetical protein